MSKERMKKLLKWQHAYPTGRFFKTKASSFVSTFLNPVTKGRGLACRTSLEEPLENGHFFMGISTYAKMGTYADC